MLKKRQPVRQFSESFKLKLLTELSEGKYTKRELSRLYDIGYTTINDWVRKYKRQDLMNQRITVQTMDELSKVKLLQKEIAKLKELLIKKDLDSLMLDAYLEVAAKVSHNAIRIYNTKRLHLSLGYKTPDHVFKMRA